jgi:hypothetical protein
VRALAPCSCQSLPLAKAGGQALGPRLRGDDEQGGVPHANFRNEVLGSDMRAGCGPASAANSNLVATRPLTRCGSLIAQARCANRDGQARGLRRPVCGRSE